MRLAQRQPSSSPIYAALTLDDDDTANVIATILMTSGARGHALGNDGRDSAVHICCEKYARLSASKPHGKEGPDVVVASTVDHTMGLLQLLCKQQTSDHTMQTTKRGSNFCTFERQVRALTHAQGAIEMRVSGACKYELRELLLLLCVVFCHRRTSQMSLTTARETRAWSQYAPRAFPRVASASR